MATTYRRNQSEGFQCLRTNRTRAEDPDSPLFDPEQRLWSRVLLMAIRDAVAERMNHVDFDFYGPSPLDWLFNDRSSGPGSYLWICSELKLAVVDEIRVFVLKATDADFRRLRQAAAASTLR